MKELQKYVAAGCPVVAIETYEDGRFCSSLLSDFPDSQVFSIASVGGMKDLQKGSTDPGAKYDSALTKFAELAARNVSNPEAPPAFLIILDYQHIIQNAVPYRNLLAALPTVKAGGCMIVLIAPAWNLPQELQREVKVLQYNLPVLRNTPYILLS